MSLQRMDNNFEVPPKRPPDWRGPGQRSDAYPSPTDFIDLRGIRAILGQELRLAPSWGPGWRYDEDLMCWRWAGHLLSDEEREDG